MKEMMKDILRIKEISDLLDNWTIDDNGIKVALTEIIKLMESLSGLSYSFKSRPGISYSLRACVDNGEEKLLTLMDIIDDDPESRWISICFYAETITDPDEEGDIIPGGLLGEDGYCFDLFHHDEEKVAYLKERIREAHAKYF
jgi:hypothetical protein